jgi:cytochrome c553
MTQLRALLVAGCLSCLPLTLHAAGLETQLEMVRALSANPTERAAAIADGKNTASFCANCHGDTGTSRYPEVPNLAGQNTTYLLTQMRKFETGERKDEFMQKLIKVLSDRDRAVVALTYAEANPAPSRAQPGPTAKIGGEHFRKLCSACHGADARGNETIPRLAGQQPKYLRMSIDRYRKATGERIFPLMSAATAQIPAQDIDAVVDYLASLR